MAIIILYIAEKEKKKKALIKETISDDYVEYICVERMLMIRVFPLNYDMEAMEGITPNQILEAGVIGNQKYYLIQLR